MWYEHSSPEITSERAHERLKQHNYGCASSHCVVYPLHCLAGFLFYARRLKQATGDPKTQQTRSEQMTYFPIYYREKERGYPYYRPQEC